MIKVTFLFTGLLISQLLFCQDSLELRRVIPGKWGLCMSEKNDNAYVCKNSWTIYIFKPDGTYSSNETTIESGRKKQVEGVWNLKGNLLTLLRLIGGENYMEKYTFEYVSENLLRTKEYVSKIENPGIPMYTYFSRVE